MVDIKFLPFNKAKGFADLETHEIFLSEQLIHDPRELINVIHHEMIHLMVQDPDHGPEWTHLANQTGIETVEEDLLKKYRKRAGVPNKIVGNIGNISGIQNLLTDFHLLQAYRKFSQRILGNEGTWEFSAETQRIRLIPVPKGSFPVVIRYLPIYTEFKKPSHREVFLRAFIAKCKQALGAARRKHGNIPSPDGGSLSLDGEALASEGKEEWDKVIEDAILLGEPLPIFVM